MEYAHSPSASRTSTDGHLILPCRRGGDMRFRGESSSHSNSDLFISQLKLSDHCERFCKMEEERVVIIDWSYVL